MRTEHQTFRVLINDAAQHSLWLQTRKVPAGWYDTGRSGTHEECLAYVREAWMRRRARGSRRCTEQVA